VEQFRRKKDYEKSFAAPFLLLKRGKESGTGGVCESGPKQNMGLEEGEKNQPGTNFANSDSEKKVGNSTITRPRKSGKEGAGRTRGLKKRGRNFQAEKQREREMLDLYRWEGELTDSYRLFFFQRA